MNIRWPPGIDEVLAQETYEQFTDMGIDEDSALEAALDVAVMVQTDGEANWTHGRFADPPAVPDSRTRTDTEDDRG